MLQSAEMTCTKMEDLYAGLYKELVEKRAFQSGERSDEFHRTLKELNEVALMVSASLQLRPCVPAHVVAFGSFQISTCNEESDLDCIALIPMDIDREEFCRKMMQQLEYHSAYYHIKFLSKTFVPLIVAMRRPVQHHKRPIEVNFLVARVSDDVIMDGPRLGGLRSFDRMDQDSVRSVSGYLNNRRLLASVPKPNFYQYALLTIKQWARERRIYGSIYGFFSGISLGVLVANAYIERPQDGHVIGIVKSFFDCYADFDWERCAVTLRDSGFKPTRHDGSHMCVMTPCSPINSTYNVTRSSLAIIKKELRNGRREIEDIMRRSHLNDIKLLWHSMFRRCLPSERFHCSVNVVARGGNNKQSHKWFGMVRSSVRYFALSLETELASGKKSSAPVMTWPWENRRSRSVCQWTIGFRYTKIRISREILEVPFDSFRSILKGRALHEGWYTDEMKVAMENVQYYHPFEK